MKGILMLYNNGLALIYIKQPFRGPKADIKAILGRHLFKMQNGRHKFIYKIANMGFPNGHTLQFPKMYRFANLHKI
jgi:hypothetical protein